MKARKQMETLETSHDGRIRRQGCVNRNFLISRAAPWLSWRTLLFVDTLLMPLAQLSERALLIYFQWQRGEHLMLFCNASINLEIFHRKRSIKCSRNQGKKHKGGRISIPIPKDNTPINSQWKSVYFRQRHPVTSLSRGTNDHPFL